MLPPDRCFELALRAPLFKAPIRQVSGIESIYDVAAAGKRFVISTTGTIVQVSPVTLVLNWQAELSKK